MEKLSYPNVLCIQYYLAGCECKGNWDSYKTYFRGDQSIWISSDLVVLFSCSDLCDYTVELSEQGIHNG